MEQYNVILNKYPASPRSKRRSASQGTSGSESASGGSILGGSSFTGYWDLITTNAAGEALEEGKEYIRTKYSAVSEKDVVAFSTEEPVADIDFPIASYNQIGLVGVTQGGGLIIDSNGYIRVDESILEGGGFDEAELRKFLNDNHYLTPTTSLYGYIPIPDNPLITAGDSVNNAFKKLELKVVDMVTISTDQTITGQKTFAKTILAQKDVIAFVSGQGEDAELPVASTTQVGMVGIKSGGGIVIDTNGYISVDPSFEGGGSGIELVVSSGTGNAVTSLTYNKTTKTLTYVKDSTFALLSQIPTALKNPYSLSWSGYSSGSYDGSSSKSISIPSNTSQLTNGAGFIKDGNGTFTVLSGSGSSSKYLAGNGTFYTISYNELSGTPDLGLYVTLAGQQTITGNKHFSAGLSSGNKSYSWINISDNNYINGMRGGNMDNLYLNFVDGSQFVRINNKCDVIATGDIVAYSTSSGVGDIAGIASSSTYGLIKYDNSTIKVNSSGQLYAVSSGGGGGSSVSWGSDSGNVVSLSVDGVTKSLALSGGFSVTGSGTQYRAVKIVGASNNFSLYGHTHSKSQITDFPASLKNPYSLTISVNGTSYSYDGSASRSITINTSSGGSWNGGTVTNSIVAPYIWINTTYSSNRLAVNGDTLLAGKTEVSGNLQVNSNLWVGTNQSSYKCAIVGNGLITGTWQQNSDMRLKNRIEGINGILMAINTLDVFRYTWKDGRDGVFHLGVSAQQIQMIFPELVGFDMDGYLNVDYTTLGVVVAIQGIKELYNKHLILENLFQSRQHWELTKDQQIKLLQDTVIRQQNEINELKEGRAA